MHNIDTDFDINLEEISKIEGAASLEIRVRNKKIEDLKFSISEWKRFYTQAIRGKPAMAVPQLVARICGTCSNAHLLASIEAVEKAFNINPSAQTILLRKLLYYGLIIRDHALHLYIFSLPDLFGKNSILYLDENDPVQRELLEDTFAVKEVGNQLSIVIGGRSVHAPMPTVGGFLKLPKIEDIKALKSKLMDIRPKILKLIEIFSKDPSDFTLQAPVTYCNLSSNDFSFLEGLVKTSDGVTIQEKDLGTHLNALIIPYSQARGFKFDGKLLMVGALARINNDKEKLHAKTKESVKEYLDLFPSHNLFYNNIAQAIEIVHAIDASIDLIDSLEKIENETPIKALPKETIGVGLIEAPRGSLYYKLEINADGTVKKGDIVVPTGQNQIVMERGIYELVEKLLAVDTPKDQIVYEIEKFIRAFDPCMSCAAHFLKVKWR
ncbi:nickel-dependent hydrogenase large subunit [Candidatus Roizmanbacteria bacterium]|nr:nickel-dependent hydrogenase large subunit [Candidatus Roizmanbacteria bacterium]